MHERPEVSVVVAAFSGEAELWRCLESLTAQDVAAEIVVASGLGPDATRRASARFPPALCLPEPAGTSALRLRARGVAAARGRLIVLTEDHCRAGSGWLAALRAAHSAGRAVVGGTVENGCGRGVQGRALYWCEYAAQMPPLPAGPARWLSGVNVAYDREALWACRDAWIEEFCEAEVHAALRLAGHEPWLAPEAVVTAHLGLGFVEALAHLYAGGRRFGRGRRARSGALGRVALRSSAPVVPALLATRVVAAVLTRRPRDAGWLALALPHLLGLVCGWAAGEAAGYWSAAERA